MLTGSQHLMQLSKSTLFNKAEHLTKLSPSKLSKSHQAYMVDHQRLNKHPVFSCLKLQQMDMIITFIVSFLATFPLKTTPKAAQRLGKHQAGHNT